MYRGWLCSCSLRISNGHLRLCFGFCKGLQGIREVHASEKNEGGAGRTKGRSKTLLEKGELNIDFGFLIMDEDEEMNET